MSGAGSPDGLARFVIAQDPLIDTVLAELSAGEKRTHWMWFVFPQLRGLGHSAIAEQYVIDSLAEARAYLAHPVLGPRLLACVAALDGSGADTLNAVFGTPDDLKFRSSMTLFALADADADGPFARSLARWCGGSPDASTLRLLDQRGPGGAG